jgi:membrane fusion protein (multidrug efflux system)
MNRYAVGIAVAVAVALAAGAGFWFGQQRTPSPPGGGMAPATQASGPATKGGPGGPPGAPAAPVEIAKVATEAMPQTITAVGSLRSDESVTIRPEVAGRIALIGFREGQPVRKGDVLVRLDASVNEAEVQQARANLKLARSKYERAVDLAKSNFISGQARDEAENNLRVAEAALALVEAKLAKTQIRAPFSGVIGLRAVSVGDYVKEAQDLVNLESIELLKVDFRLPEVHLRQVQSGQTLQVSLDALPGKTFEGRVLAVNPLVDAAGRAVVVRAQVRNSDASLRPGMFARVRLLTEDKGEAMVVPEQALVPQGTEQFVFKVVDGKAVRSKVETGQRRGGKVEVRNGVAAGDLVVTAGQLRLRDGVAVAIVNRPAGNAAPNDGTPPTASDAAAPKGVAGPASRDKS